MRVLVIMSMWVWLELFVEFHICIFLWCIMYVLFVGFYLFGWYNVLVGCGVYLFVVDWECFCQCVQVVYEVVLFDVVSWLFIWIWLCWILFDVFVRVCVCFEWL